MLNVFDYLKWRGDLSFLKDGVGEVDGLILSCLSYVPFDGIVPKDTAALSLKTAAALLLEKEGQEGEEVHFTHKDDRQLLIEAAGTRRFGETMLSRYVNDIDEEEEKQFSAITISLEDGTDFIAFRGTDDTLIGWKEDFNMSFLPILPSQREAVTYLNACIGDRLLWVGGHSKGGNLAVFAALYCKATVRDRILKIYNFDGPGFLEAVTEGEEYQRIESRIRAYLPQTSIVGMLFRRREEYRIVESSQFGPLQHSIYSWSVDGPGFGLLDDLTPGSRFVDSTVREWLMAVDLSRRKQFTDALYEILSVTNIQNFSELNDGWLRAAAADLQALKHVDEGTKKVVSEALRLLLKIARKNLGLLQKKKTK